jgi:hypothetical protein
VEQGRDLVVAVDVRGRAPRDAPEEPRRRDLGGWVERGAMSREGADGSKASFGTSGLARGRGQGPTRGERNRNRPSVTDPVRVACEVTQAPPQPVGVEPETTAQVEVVVDEIKEARRTHGVTSGHGKATSRSARMSSLA